MLQVESSRSRKGSIEASASVVAGRCNAAALELHPPGGSRSDGGQSRNSQFANFTSESPLTPATGLRTGGAPRPSTGTGKASEHTLPVTKRNKDNPWIAFHYTPLRIIAHGVQHWTQLQRHVPLAADKSNNITSIRQSTEPMLSC